MLLFEYGVIIGVLVIGFVIGVYWDCYYWYCLWYFDCDCWVYCVELRFGFGGMLLV